MPASGWAMAYLFALAEGDAAARAELREYCAQAEVDYDAVIAEIGGAAPDMRERVHAGLSGDDAFPKASLLLRGLRNSDFWQTMVNDKLSLGSEMMRDLGNLYTAALPAWLAAGFVQALREKADLDGQRWLALGYGSGDAAEAVPMQVAGNWRDAAARINFVEALGDPLDLDQDQYVALHDGRVAALDPVPAHDEFVVDAIGERDEPDFRDVGIEYYRYVANGHTLNRTR